MNNRLSMIVLIIVSAQAMTLMAQQHAETDLQHEIAWYDKAAHWLAGHQEKNGGWCNTYSQGMPEDKATPVVTDPATTAFAATALLEAGGSLDTNPYCMNILHAAHYILLVIEAKSVHGKKKKAASRQLELKLGMHIDATRTVDFLASMRDQLPHARDVMRLNNAIAVCLELIHNREARTQSGNLIISSLRSIETAGIELLGLSGAKQVSIENDASASTAMREAGKTAVHGLLSLGIDALVDEVEQKISGKQYDRLMAAAFKANEEFLAHALYSESLESLDYDSWLEWKHGFEHELQASQQDDGGWGEIPGTSNVFCTAAALLAWHGKPFDTATTAGE